MTKNKNALVFNGLMQGMSWDLIKEAKEEIQRHLGEKLPTRKDILIDWIIGKDYMLQLLGEQYKKGGHLFYGDPYSIINNTMDKGFLQAEDYLSFLEKTSDNNTNSLNNITMGSGTYEGMNSMLAPAVGGVANSLNYSDYWGNSSAVNKAAYGDSSADPITRAFGLISGTTLKEGLDEIEAKRQGNILNLNYGDNASLMAQIEAYNRNKEGYIPKLKDPSAAGIIVDFLNSTGLGALHGMTAASNSSSSYSTLGLGALIGAGIGSFTLLGNALGERSNRRKLNAAILNANNDLVRNDEIINYTVNNNQSLNAFNQLQHMTKNGGKLNKSHKFAEGGLLNTYDYGLEEVNAGGSHEENPNEGVVVSYAPDGLPNKVEEGETIHNDYVYSKRLEANEKVLKNNLLDEKYEGKSFADISKKLTEDRKKRPNDPISVRTNEENLNRLQEALEELKLDNKTKEVKRFLGNLNNDLLNALQLEMMDEYEAYAELLAQQLEQEDLAYQEEQAALEGIFGRGGHLKQGKTSSRITATEPVYDEEGNIKGWRTPDVTPTEKVLNLLGYNPNYEGALIYADDRNWFERNITSPWNTWWNNLSSPEFSLAVRNFTPVGAIDAIINGDTERLLAAANTGGPVQRNIFDDVEETNLTRGLQQDRAIDKMWRNAEEELVSSKAPSKTSTPKTSTRKPKKASTQLKQVSQEANNNTSNSVTEETRKAKFLRRLKNFGITAGISTGVGAAVNLGVKETERLKAIKDIYDSEIPILESDSVKVPYSNTNNYIYSPDSSYWYDPVEGRMFYKKSKGGRLFLGGGFAPYEFEEVNGEVFAHRNVNRNGNIVTLTIPEAEFTPEMVTAYGIWNQRNNSNISTKNTPVKPKSTSTIKSTTISPIAQETSNNSILSITNTTEVSSNTPIYDSFKTIFGPYIQNSLMGPKPFEEDFSKNSKPNISDSPQRNPELEPNYLSYLRYAPILGSLGLVLSDTLGLTNQPDYSNINMYRRAVDSIGGVNFVPIGGYLQHTPIDREYIANQQLALAAAYNRSLNNANPVGSYILGLVNDAKVRDQIGDMYINAAAQDLKNRLAVAEYNRGIDITNARNSLAAQSENARLRALRANEYLSIANMMTAERNTAEAARAANYLGLFTNIGNLGADEMNRTMVNRNPALFYGTNRDGSIYFKNAFWGLSEDTQNELIDMLEKQGYKISK